MVEYSAYVGLDVHKETISVAIAFPGRRIRCFGARAAISVHRCAV